MTWGGGVVEKVLGFAAGSTAMALVFKGVGGGLAGHSRPGHLSSWQLPLQKALWRA